MRLHFSCASVSPKFCVKSRPSGRLDWTASSFSDVVSAAMEPWRWYSQKGSLFQASTSPQSQYPPPPEAAIRYLERGCKMTTLSTLTILTSFLPQEEHQYHITTTTCSSTSGCIVVPIGTRFLNIYSTTQTTRMPTCASYAHFCWSSWCKGRKWDPFRNLGSKTSVHHSWTPFHTALKRW